MKSSKGERKGSRAERRVRDAADRRACRAADLPDEGRQRVTDTLTVLLARTLQAADLGGAITARPS
ncbi:hypothetical protein [Nonomuraea bangladeshensis]|uniref:hypothetical protein n=1 Tax=Nonomuraea bangladeshensis TaxID=404385 RepID=UPI003C2AB216